MKRKYTRKASKPSLVGEGSNGNLPPDILASIEKTLEMRKSLGLSDDREERIQRALRYQGFIRGRK